MTLQDIWIYRNVIAQNASRAIEIKATDVCFTTDDTSESVPPYGYFFGVEMSDVYIVNNTIADNANGVYLVAQREQEAAISDTESVSLFWFGSFAYPCYIVNNVLSKNDATEPMVNLLDHTAGEEIDEDVELWLNTAVVLNRNVYQYHEDSTGEVLYVKGATAYKRTLYQLAASETDVETPEGHAEDYWADKAADNGISASEVLFEDTGASDYRLRHAALTWVSYTPTGGDFTHVYYGGPIPEVPDLLSTAPTSTFATLGAYEHWDL